jgi:hypothetical protein
MIKLTAIALVALNALFTASASDQWSATLNPSDGGTISGTATVEGVGSADSTLVKISVNGAAPNATLPWHIHNGPCGATKAVLGSESAYPKLMTSDAGSAQASVTLPVRPSKTGSYAVQVHRGTAMPEKPGSDVIACGDLKLVMNKTPDQ